MGGVARLRLALPLRPASPLRLLARTLGAAGLAALIALGGCATDRSAKVWFAPNLGSPDMLGLFTQPQAWSKARGSVGVFKFYEQHLISERPADCPSCGPNLLPAFEQAGAFGQLRDWGVAIAVEVGVIKGHTCAPEANAALALTAIRNVELRGGSVRYLAMDEPLLGAGDCKIGLEQAAKDVAAFARQVHAAYPSVGIGELEPYPEFGVPKLTAWMAALQGEGFAPAFIHLDVDRQRSATSGLDVAVDLQNLKKLVDVQQIPFGVVFWGADGTDEAGYAADVLSWVDTVRQAIGEPTHSVFQSWSRSADGRFVVPRNLPETDSATMTHTRLLNDGLRALRAGS
jgi:hypothetical protein